MASPQTRTYTLPEQIADRLGDAIVAGSYAPGVWIGEQSLAELFAVSRGPIRDALRILEKEGLIQIHPRRGAIVTKLTTGDVMDIARIRAALLGLAACLAAGRDSAEVKARLDDTLPKLDRLLSKGDAADFARYAAELCALLAEASANGRLQEMLLSMSRQTLPLAMKAMAVRQNRRDWAANWRAIVAAVTAGNEAEAERAARRLIDDAAALAVKLLTADALDTTAAVPPLPGKRVVKVMPADPVSREEVAGAWAPRPRARKDPLAAVKGDRIRVMPEAPSSLDIEDIADEAVALDDDTPTPRRRTKSGARTS